jgi:hypothetical protein
MIRKSHEAYYFGIVSPGHKTIEGDKRVRVDLQSHRVASVALIIAMPEGNHPTSCRIIMMSAFHHGTPALQLTENR